MIDLRRRLRVRQQLADGQTQHQTIDHRHPLEPPVVRVRDEQLVDRLDTGERLPHEVVRKRPQVVVHSAPISSSVAATDPSSGSSTGGTIRQKAAIASCGPMRPTSD